MSSHRQAGQLVYLGFFSPPCLYSHPLQLFLGLWDVNIPCSASCLARDDWEGNHRLRMRSGHFLISSPKTCLMPATATICMFLTLLLLTCLALACTTWSGKIISTGIFVEGSRGRQGVPQGAGNGISSSRGGEGWAGSAGSCLGAQREEEPCSEWMVPYIIWLWKNCCGLSLPCAFQNVPLRCCLHSKG